MTTPYSATQSHPACITQAQVIQAAHPPLGDLVQLRCCYYNPPLQQRHLGGMASRDWPSSAAPVPQHSRTTQRPLASRQARRLQFRSLHMRLPQPVSSAYLPHHGSMQPGKIPVQPYLYSRCSRLKHNPAPRPSRHACYLAVSVVYARPVVIVLLIYRVRMQPVPT
jgi:hypothetical protein